MFDDRRGLALSCNSQEAAGLFDAALDDMLEYRARTAQSIQCAINADPAFMMPHILMAGGMLLMGTNIVRPALETKLGEIETLTSQSNLTKRERLHAKALQAWACGDLKAACAHWESIVLDHPHDLLALRSLHFQNFWMGNAAYMRNATGAALASWSEDMPGYGFVLGMTAFGFEECGDYSRAERLAREAVARNPDDLWSVHAVAHVLEMQGRLSEGSSWLDGPDDQWLDRGPFKGHLWWHAALFAVERERFGHALDLYDRHIKPGEKFVSTDMMNAPSLLARLEFQGIDVGNRWTELASRSLEWIGNHVVPFTDAHTMFPLARTQMPEADDYLLSLEKLGQIHTGYAADIAEPYLVPLAKAVRAFYRKDYDQTIEILMPLRAQLQPIGGSHAQRDLFHQLLTEAAIKHKKWLLARSLLNERVTLRPDNLSNHRKMAMIENSVVH